MIFTLQGSPLQRQIIQAALKRCDFPFKRLEQGLRNQTGRSTIPIDWQDLTRYLAQAQKAKEERGARHHQTTVTVIERGGDKATLIEWRHRVLGLAWYSGRITLDISLTNEPQLAGEVFLSECAHMWDFFGMTMEERVRAYNAYHEDSHDLPDDALIYDGVPLGEHECGWFDVGDYYSWVGEALMGAFVMAFSDYEVTMEFPNHTATRQIADEVRAIVFPPPPKPTPPVIEEPIVEQPAQPEIIEPGPVEPSPLPSPEEHTLCAFKRSKVFHGPDCRMVKREPDIYFDTKEQAEESLRPCKVCKP